MSLLRPRRLDDEVLLALLEGPTGGTALLARLDRSGMPTTAADLLGALLAHEDRGHVRIDRTDGYEFELTSEGELAARSAGAGSARRTTLVMVDLVGFVGFTDREGDERAHEVADGLATAARRRFAARGGSVVKLLGDGVLATIDPDADALVVLRDLAEDCRQLGGATWELRGAVHQGEPIHHRGDLYGRDVNLVARLCELADPGCALVTAPNGARDVELLEIRGLREPIAVRREPLRPERSQPEHLGSDR